MDPAAFVAVLLLLAAARLTRLVTDDQITAPLRLAAARRDQRRRPDGTTGPLTYLLHCRWCLGLWISGPAACLAWWPGHLAHLLDVPAWLGVPALTLAFSHLVGIGVRAEGGA